MFSDYCDNISVKVKYLDLYDYIFKFVLFVVSLEGRHFGSTESKHVSFQNTEPLVK